VHTEPGSAEKGLPISRQLKAHSSHACKTASFPIIQDGFSHYLRNFDDLEDYVDSGTPEGQNSLNIRGSVMLIYALADTWFSVHVLVVSHLPKEYPI